MKKFNLGILTFTLTDSGSIPLSNLIDILSPIADDLFLVTGGAGYESFKTDARLKTYGVKHIVRSNVIGRIFEYVHTQIKISYQIFKIRNVDKWIFFIGGDTLLLPMLTAKLMRKEVFLVFAGSTIETLKVSGDNFYKFAKILSKINCTLSNKIILYSERLTEEWELKNYKKKIIITHRHFLDFNKFTVKKKLLERENIVGYFGRLSKEKGALNFVESIPEILKSNNELKFLICGNGPLEDEIKEYIQNKSLNEKVTLLNWVNHEDIPDYLNKLKLLILPSYTEGLPKIVIEAMACGTPVLTTHVGAIPDIVKDGKTGFILKKNSPECISKNVLISLNQDIQKISDESVKFVKINFLYDNILDKWIKLINE